MLYDNGGRGGPLPMPQRPQPIPQPQPPMGFKDALAARANKIRASMGNGTPFKFQDYLQRKMPTAYAAPRPQQQMMQRPMFGLPMTGGQSQGGGANGYTRPNPGGQRDINGNLPGEWDYMQPQPQQQRPPMVGYGQYAPPQYQGNPFLPQMPY